jgi:rhamnosyltransferase
LLKYLAVRAWTATLCCSLSEAIQISSNELVLDSVLTTVDSAATDTAAPLPALETICAVVVTYYPDSGFADRMERVAKQVGQIVIVDNRSQGESLGRIQEVVERLGIHLIPNASNEGIARALNAGVRWAASRGYRWVLTLDQDTLVAADMVSSLAHVFRSYPFPQKAAVVGSNYRDQFSKPTLSDDPIEPGGFGGKEVKTVLTSGSLISVDAFDSIGGFREDFFMDCVDHEYCLRARSHGYRILMTAKPVMEHGPGDPSQHRLLWRKFRTSNHSISRRYFLARNSTILVREYAISEPGWILYYLWEYAKSMLLLCLFETHRAAKLKGSIRGCIDGILGRTSISVE